MIFGKKEKKKVMCSICHQRPATTTIPGPLGPVKVCQVCKKQVKI